MILFYFSFYRIRRWPKILRDQRTIDFHVTKYKFGKRREFFLSYHVWIYLYENKTQIFNRFLFIKSKYWVSFYRDNIGQVQRIFSSTNITLKSETHVYLMLLSPSASNLLRLIGNVYWVFLIKIMFCSVSMLENIGLYDFIA